MKIEQQVNMDPFTTEAGRFAADRRCDSVASASPTSTGQKTLPAPKMRKDRKRPSGERVGEWITGW